MLGFGGFKDVEPPMLRFVATPLGFEGAGAGMGFPSPPTGLPDIALDREQRGGKYSYHIKGWHTVVNGYTYLWTMQPQLARLIEVTC